MAFDGSINIDSSIDGSGVSKGLEKLGGVAKSTLSGLLTVIGGVAAAAGGAAVAGVKYNAQMEQYITSFGTMLGSAGKATDLVSQLKKFAADTPFEFTDLAKGSQTLLSFGVSASDLMPTLKMLGDVSQGNTDKFNALSLAFGQVSSAGKMQGQDLLQFINAGFNPLQVMAQKTGKSMSDLRDEMAAGKISAQDVADAFKTATSAGGMFYNAMESQSKTFSGQLSTLKDNASQFLGELTAGLESSLKDTALPMVNGWMDQLQSAFNSGGVQGVVAAFGMVLSKAVSAVASQAPQMIGLATSLIQAFLNGLISNATSISSAASSIVTELITGLTSLLPQLTDVALQLIIAFANGIAQNAGNIVSNGTALIDSLVSVFEEAAPQLAAAAVKLAQAFFNALMQQHPTGTPLVGAVIAAVGAVKGVQGAFKGLDAIASGLDKLSTSGGLLKKAFQTISGPFKDAKGNLDIIRVAASETGDKFKVVGKAIGSGLLSAVKGVGSAFQGLFSILMANPIILVIALIAAAVAAIIILWNTNAGFRNAIIGAWNAVLGAAQSVWGAIVGFFTKTIPAAWNSFIAFLKTWGPAILAVVMPFIGIPLLIIQHWNVIGPFLQNLLASIIQWFQQLPYNIGMLLGTIVRHVADFGTAVWGWVTGTLPTIILGIIQWFQQLPGRIWAFLMDVVSRIGQWGSDMWSYLSVQIPQIINAIGNWFAQLPARIWNWLLSTINNIGHWGSSMYSSAVSAASRMINAVGDWFAQLPGRIWNWLLSVIQHVGSWGSSMYSKATSAASSVVNGVIDFFSKLPGRVLSIGSDVIHGIWNGITGGAGWLWDKISGFCNQFVTGFKKGLRINSPSRLMRDEIGAMLPPGIAIGFEDAMPGAVSDMQAQMDMLTAKMQASVTAQQGNAAFSVAAGSAPLVSVTVQPAPVELNADARKLGLAVTGSQWAQTSARRYK